MKGKNLDDSNLGSKAASGAYQAIIALMPPHDTYIELFLGISTLTSTAPYLSLFSHKYRQRRKWSKP
ncbi:hypothetical protein [Yersinia enterocolitica]|uniref:hypothetical protein n=1 Tax=Yersinia enterocolitica TaxID=630 RepID=UPI001C60AC1E|nr:hypothetical protein [Yersinia enterocolitica]MBW5840060.1 hypothetical protein [Yersinia enterocolitica]MBW5848674.1 hypothetical protein [Yersinia enterocolitica]MBW5857412.1 hypothetical protein [Yersinia enterocolitica]MBW5861744.1 hypothetical protein [Yersinia enterocolitica]MBW5866087.1 hypothetical protein [Yersinia enterocolitica]